jgi:hypothetical protein
MSNVLIILAAMGIMVLLVAYFAFLVLIYHRYFKRKGYVNPFTILLFPLAIVFALFVGLIGLMRTRHGDDSSYIALFLLGPVFLVTFAIYFIARLLPPRPRNAKPRTIRFPYAFLGWSLIAGGAIQILVFGFMSGWKAETLSRSYKFFQITLGLGFGCLYIAKRAKAPSAEQLLAADARPPVLYLRAFNLEEQYFVLLPPKEAARYTSYLGSKAAVTLEQYLAPSIRQGIGPLVALGNPEDYAPPEGAARTYERDDHWKERFLDLAHRSACIIIQVGESQNLRWEFEALKREALQEKCFLLTPPAKKLNLRYRALLSLSRKILNWTLWIKGSRPTCWANFAEGIQAAGYDVVPAEPPPGSILSFDCRGSQILLATNAQEPGEFVAAMLHRLQAKAA